MQGEAKEQRQEIDDELKQLSNVKADSNLQPQAALPFFVAPLSASLSRKGSNLTREVTGVARNASGAALSCDARSQSLRKSCGPCIKIICPPCKLLILEHMAQFDCCQNFSFVGAHDDAS